jgi:hypothetical protein
LIADFREDMTDSREADIVNFRGILSVFAVIRV